MTQEWYFQTMGQDVGPLTAAELKGKVNVGQVQSDTLVRKGREGKWVFAADVKGLIPPPRELPVPPSPPSPKKPEPPAPILDLKAAWMSNVPTSIRMADETEEEPDSSSHEFYNFVGFRDAISPALYDAVKQFVTDCGITISQFNRHALAEAIGRPELGGNLMISALTPYPWMGAADGPPADQALPASDRENATVGIRISFGNRGSQTILLQQAVLLPIRVESDHRDLVGDPPPRSEDNSEVVAVRLTTVAPRKAVRFSIDQSVGPRGTGELAVRFQYTEPKSIRVQARMLLGGENDFILSNIFWIALRG